MISRMPAALATSIWLFAPAGSAATADRPVAGYGLWATVLTVTEDSYVSPNLEGVAVGDSQLTIFGSAYSGFVAPDHYAAGRHKYFYAFPDMPEGRWIASSTLAGRLLEIASTDRPDHCGYLFDFCRGDLGTTEYQTASGWFGVTGIVDHAWNGTEADPRGTNPAQWRIEEFIAFEDLSEPGSYETFVVRGTSFTPDTASGTIGRTSSIPLPAPVVLLGAALAGLAGLRRRRRG